MRVREYSPVWLIDLTKCLHNGKGITPFVRPRAIFGLWKTIIKRSTSCNPHLRGRITVTCGLGQQFTLKHRHTYSHTHTHTHFLCLSLTHAHTLSHAHTYTHTHFQPVEYWRTSCLSGFSTRFCRLEIVPLSHEADCRGPASLQRYSDRSRKIGVMRFEEESGQDWKKTEGDRFWRVEKSASCSAVVAPKVPWQVHPSSLAEKLAMNLHTSKLWWFLHKTRCIVGNKPFLLC